jgi:asparagine synthetase B (glutamine-hydrolysing)
MNFRYIPNEKTLFKNVHRLPAGSFAIAKEGRWSLHRYFSLEKESTQISISYEQSKEKLSHLLEEATKSHLMSEVELGAYLSGGIDSSTVCYFTKKHTKTLKTFCLGFGEPTDETESAKLFADTIGSNHQSFLLSKHFLNQYQKILYHVEEPKINLLQGYAMAEKISPLVKVVLSGLGGDELFAGYEHHDFFYLASQLKWAGNFSKGLPIEFFQKKINKSTWDHFFRAAEMGGHLNSPIQFYAISRTFEYLFSQFPKLILGFSRHAKSAAAQTGTTTCASLRRRNASAPAA